MDDLTESQLRALAEKATRGPWVANGPEIVAPDASVPHGDGSMPSVARAWPHLSAFDDSVRLTSGTEDDNAAFIAAANPATVLALLDEISALREQIKEAYRDAAEAIHGPGGWNDALTVEAILRKRAENDLKKSHQDVARLAESHSTGSDL